MLRGYRLNLDEATLINDLAMTGGTEAYVENYNDGRLLMFIRNGQATQSAGVVTQAAVKVGVRRRASCASLGLAHIGFVRDYLASSRCQSRV